MFASVAMVIGQVLLISAAHHGSFGFRNARLSQHQPAGSELASDQEPVNKELAERLDDTTRGKQIYLQQCAQCHGERGEGTEQYSLLLTGDLAVDELASLIDATMPEDAPEQCVGNDAKEVARYIYDAFYSAEAQRTHSKPQVDFSRLTERQFRESVTDLFGNFDPPVWHSPERGLKAHYFASRNWNAKRKLAEQVDANINFGDGVPHFSATGEYPNVEPKKEDENQMGDGFSVYWSGSVLAPQTGVYSFRVESKNGFQLRVNQQEPPLIDRKVRSDDVENHEATIFLQAGRAYRLKIEFFSYPDPPARIRLLWKPPHGVEEVIPQDYLMPHELPVAMVVASPFPPDDSSHGYARGISVSQEWDEAVTAAAMEAAEWAAERMWHLAQAKDSDEDRLEKIKSFCVQWVEFSFVKNLTNEEQAFFVDQHFDNELLLKDQVKRVVMLAIKSPRFLFPELEQRDPHFTVARRLALGIWDSIPDRELFELAEQGKLTDPQVIEGQLWRMMSHPKAAAKLSSFFADWLQMDRAHHAARDPERFPGFDAELLVESRRSLENFVHQIAWSDSSDYRQLFLAPHIFENPRLAQYYGPETETGTSRYVGVLSHPYLMTGFAHYRDSSPIHRGVFVARNLLGRSMKQPNENFEPLTEDFDPSMTNRQRVEYQTKETSCMSCHAMINPLGFSLENYDAVGRFRETEKEKPIDASAVYRTAAGENIPLNSSIDLAHFLVGDETAQKHFIRRLFQHYIRQPIDAYGESTLDDIHQGFVDSDFHIRQTVMLVVKATVSEYVSELP